MTEDLPWIGRWPRHWNGDHDPYRRVHRGRHERCDFTVETPVFPGYLSQCVGLLGHDTKTYAGAHAVRPVKKLR